VGGTGVIKKRRLNLSVQDASAALPQNCQTTMVILRLASESVNVTSVTLALARGNR
jgi:hypothetical protein